MKEGVAAKKRMVGAHASPGKLPELSLGRTRDKIGANAGMSGTIIERASQVVEAAEAEPKKYGPLVEEMDRTGRRPTRGGVPALVLSSIHTHSPAWGNFSIWSFPLL